MNDIYVCAVYIPPQHTANLYCKKVDYFQCLYDGLLKYKDEGNIILTGDFNARVGVDLSEPFETPLVDEICPPEAVHTTKQRLSCDNKVNSYGKKLLQLCKAFNLQIANGSVPGDKLGSFTCYANRGASVVDYVICDQNLINISKMKILPPEFGSVHTPIYFKLDYKVCIEKSDESLLPLPPKFRWDPSKAETLSLLMGRHDNLDDLDDITMEFTDIMFDNANSCLNIVKRRKAKPGNPSSKTWYNTSCSSLKRRLTNLSKLLVKSPKDPFIRGKYINLKKEYRQIIRKSKKAYEVNNIDKLNELTQHPKKFRGHLKKLRGNKQSNIGNYISKEEWIEHFTSLNNKDPSNSPHNYEYCNEIEREVLNKLESQQNNLPCGILEKEVTILEVEAAIKKLKKGKASSIDSISNDIIKVAAKHILPTLAALFNKLIKLHHFPYPWAFGMIIPIHKSGELDDPNNFRGITLNSCLSKLVTLIMNERLTIYCDKGG